MKRIGILCASNTKLAPFLPHIPDAHITKKAMLEFHGGQIGETEIVAVYSGVCKVNAAIAAQLLIDYGYCRSCRNWELWSKLWSSVQTGGGNHFRAVRTIRKFIANLRQIYTKSIMTNLFPYVIVRKRRNGQLPGKGTGYHETYRKILSIYQSVQRRTALWP